MCCDKGCVGGARVDFWRWTALTLCAAIRVVSVVREWTSEDRGNVLVAYGSIYVNVSGRRTMLCC